MYGKVVSSWITLNRACNLNCHWCYAKNSQGENMAFSDVTHLVDFLKTIDVKHITFIGGEPSIYPNICDAFSYATNKGIKAGMVTNGIALKNLDFLRKLVDSGMTGVGLSLKGYDSQSFIDTTGIDKYTDVIEAVENLANEGIPFSVSFVMTIENIGHINQGINDVINAGCKKIRLSFCYDFETCRTDAPSDAVNPYLLAKRFMEEYDRIEKASNGTFELFQNLPLCVWDKGFIELLAMKKQIRSGCQLLNKNGIIFDTDMTIIPCNAMYDYKIGKFGENFTDLDSFNKFWNCKEIVEYYNKLRAIPSLECAECKQYKFCGGGCLSNWFSYSFKELKEMKL